MKNHLTMQQLEVLGFKVVKSYEHNNFITQRRKKGLITVETTWKQTGEFESQDLSIEEVNGIEFTLTDLINLDNLLYTFNQKTDFATDHFLLMFCGSIVFRVD